MKTKLYLYALSFIICLFIGRKDGCCHSNLDSLNRLINKENRPLQKYALYLERARSYAPKDSSAAFKDINTVADYYQQIHYSEGLVSILLTRAEVYYNLKDYRQLAEESQKAISLSQNTADKKGEALAYGYLSWSLFYLKDLKGAQKCLQKAINIEETLKPLAQLRLIERYGLLGTIETKLGRYNESISAFEAAINLGESLSDKRPLIKIYANYAHSLDITSQSPKALLSHMTAIKIAEACRDSTWLMREYNNIAIVYKNLKEFEEAIHYYKQSLRIAAAQKNYRSMGLSIMNIAILNDEIGKPDKNDSLFNTAINYFKQAKDQYGEAMVYHNFGNWLVSLNQYRKAERYLNKALALRKKLQLIPLQASTLSVLGKLTIAQKRWQDAEKYLNEAEQIYQKHDNNNRLLRDLYRYKKQLYYGKKDFKKAFENQAKEMTFSQKLYDESKKINALKHQAEYELEKRDRLMDAERIAYHQKQRYLFGISGFILLILLLSLLMLLQRRKNARERHKAEVLQLKQEHRLALADSLAKAEQEERKKIANRLHDETNGILSIARLNLDRMEENVPTEFVGWETQIKNLKKLLTDASASIRGISHSLMPLTLERHGLKVALKELIAAINNAAKIKIEFVIEGLEQTLSWNPQICLAIYRMTHEAFNNIIKHAQANHVLFQIVELEDSVTIYIEDDGSGFNNTVAQKNGIGLTSLKQSIEYLNGRIDINSEKNKGTFILAEIPIR